MRVPGPTRAGLNSIPGVTLGPPDGELPSASLSENARLNALVIVPNALQGLFRRRPRAVAAATMAGVDRWAVALLGGMKRRYGGGPVWVRVVSDRALLLLSVDDVRRVLEGSPEPFASDPEAKRKGMAHFQPDALTISRGELWTKRRQLTEGVLETSAAVHSLGDRFCEVARDEARAAVDGHRGRSLEWDGFHAAVQRATRRIVLGEAAADDEVVTELLEALMSEANSLPSEPSEELGELEAKVAGYVEAAEPGSLAALASAAPADEETKAIGQLPHWLFALGDTLAINTWRCLALLATHSDQRARALAEIEAEGAGSADAVARLAYLEACLHEAMRLWPTTPMLSRETITDIDWNGATVPAGTQVIFVNTYMHRDHDALGYADRFIPDVWIDGGEAARSWRFNHFSHGPQGCPGTNLALLVGKAMLAAILTDNEPRLVQPKLDPDGPLPHMLNFFELRFELGMRA